MNTLNIDGQQYKVPNHVIETNQKSQSIYDMLYLNDIISGEEDFDRLDNDFLESECFSAYAEHHGIDEDDACISAVRNSMYAYYQDYKGEDCDLFLIEKV